MVRATLAGCYTTGVIRTSIAVLALLRVAGLTSASSAAERAGPLRTRRRPPLGQDRIPPLDEPRARRRAQTRSPPSSARRVSTVRVDRFHVPGTGILATWSASSTAPASCLEDPDRPHRQRPRGPGANRQRLGRGRAGRPRSEAPGPQSRPAMCGWPRPGPRSAASPAPPTTSAPRPWSSRVKRRGRSERSALRLRQRRGRPARPLLAALARGHPRPGVEGVILAAARRAGVHRPLGARLRAPATRTSASSTSPGSGQPCSRAGMRTSHVASCRATGRGACRSASLNRALRIAEEVAKGP